MKMKQGYLLKLTLRLAADGGYTLVDRIAPTVYTTSELAWQDTERFAGELFAAEPRKWMPDEWKADVLPVRYPAENEETTPTPNNTAMRKITLTNTGAIVLLNISNTPVATLTRAHHHDPLVSMTNGEWDALLQSIERLSEQREAKRIVANVAAGVPEGYTYYGRGRLKTYAKRNEMNDVAYFTPKDGWVIFGSGNDPNVEYALRTGSPLAIANGL